MTLLATPASHIEPCCRWPTHRSKAVTETRSSPAPGALCARLRAGPGAPSEARFVPRRVLREHQDQADELIAVARAGVEQLYRHVAELGYVILLTDSPRHSRAVSR